MSAADRLAEKLRDDPPALDEVTRARMERDLLERRHVAAPESRSRAPVFVAGIALGAVAAGALVYVMAARPEPAPTLATEGEPAAETVVTPHEDPPAEVGPVAYETLRDGVPVGQGHLAEGDAVQTAEGQLLRLRFGGAIDASTSLVEVAPDSRVRFDRASGDDLSVALERGSVRVEFHPHRRGEEHLTVRTRDGRVEVVGTAFEVHLGPEGTEVVVEEGTVRLVGHGGDARLVSHGERAWLRRQAEPAVRASSAPPAPVEGEVVEGEVVEAVAEEAVAEAAPAAEPAPSVPLDAELRFTLADRYFAQGRFEAARHELYAVTRSSRSRAVKAQAWTRVAEAFDREAEPGRAAEAYRRAARVGRGTSHGDSALFALARLLGVQGDRSGARAAYERYLQAAPAGPLAGQATRALCRLGVRRHCGE